MIFTVDYSFHNSNFCGTLINSIKSLAFVKSIKYSVNFEWYELSDFTNLSSLKFDQLHIETDLFDTINIQLFESILPRVFITNIGLGAKDKFVELVESSFLNDLCYGKVSEAIDNILQNVETPDSWRRKKRQLPAYVKLFPNPFYTNERENELVSLESLPGHNHQMNYDEKLWFGSSWQMYFSSVYYKYIPKFLFDEFHDCTENKIFENGLRRITLFENPHDFDLPKNRERQWSFRRKLGIDSIAHELTKKSNRIEPINLPIIITKLNCAKGNTRVEIRNNTELIIREFLDDGITLVFEESKMVY